MIHGDFDYSKVTIYLVGGFVRDHFMGKTPNDKDYVVVGSSPDEMVSLGFKQVGADFPVFLHPETGDEYALARTERKQGFGYKGFQCDWNGVTLEEDLSRRDLTINAIAWDCSRNLGKVHDPFNGIQDIKDKILRPVSQAFQEDPLRCLRAARFMAQFPDFELSRELLKMMYEVRYDGSLNDLTRERVWIEIVKALDGVRPSNFFVVCTQVLGIFPTLDNMYGVPQNKDHHPEEEDKRWERG